MLGRVEQAFRWDCRFSRRGGGGGGGAAARRQGKRAGGNDCRGNGHRLRHGNKFRLVVVIVADGLLAERAVVHEVVNEGLDLAEIGISIVWRFIWVVVLVERGMIGGCGDLVGLRGGDSGRSGRREGKDVGRRCEGLGAAAISGSVDEVLTLEGEGL